MKTTEEIIKEFREKFTFTEYGGIHDDLELKKEVEDFLREALQAQQEAFRGKTKREWYTIGHTDAIKEVEEMIGEDEETHGGSARGAGLVCVNEARNELRAELRAKLKEMK